MNTRISCDHPAPPNSLAVPVAELIRAAELFQALGDPERLRLLEVLTRGERCVSELVQALGDKFSTVSQRLRLLRDKKLVTRRREGTHLFYALADGHVLDLIRNALEHAAEETAERLSLAPHPPHRKGEVMSHSTHAGHDHQHGPGCGHKAVRHGDHVDYLHDGHLHHPAGGDQVEEHALEVDAANPSACTPGHSCGGHEAGHKHGAGCGHEAVPHGDHVDYLVDGHLHHPHGDHCDDHGPVKLA